MSQDGGTNTTHWLTVVGIGEDGWDGLGAEARSAIEAASVVAGGARHLSLLPVVPPRLLEWEGRIAERLDELLLQRGRPAVVVASGDPLLYGVGAMLARRLPPGEVRFLPAVSSYSLATAAMGWSATETALVSVCGRPLEALALELFDGARIIILSADRSTPKAVAGFLVANGFSRSEMTVFGHLGGPRERRWSLRAADGVAGLDLPDLNCLAIFAVADQLGAGLSRVPGLPDTSYETDGQITKREVRAMTIAALAPRPGELLWDIGAGSGSIGIEWLRSTPRVRAIGIEADPVRAERARGNAARLGVPSFQVIDGRAPAALADLPDPDAIFVGGGFTEPGVLDHCWRCLKPGGRLVANAVTLETEALLLAAYQRLGGSLTRISIDRADPVGRLTGWRPAMPVIQWFARKQFAETTA